MVIPCSKGPWFLVLSGPQAFHIKKNLYYVLVFPFVDLNSESLLNNETI